MATPGFTTEGQLRALYAVLAVNQGDVPGALLEVGVYCGRSFLAVAAAAKVLGCTAYGLDPFPQGQDWENMYPHGVEEVARVGVAQAQECIDPRGRALAALGRANLPGTLITGTTEGSALWNIGPLRGVFIDGDHAYEAVCLDLLRVEPYLSPGALVILDDFQFPGVARATTDLLTPQRGYERWASEELFIVHKGEPA